VAAEGLRIRRLTGDELRAPALWDAFYRFYNDTIDRKWGSPYLTRRVRPRRGRGRGRGRLNASGSGGAAV
jgi:hypothetical protein